MNTTGSNCNLCHWNCIYGFIKNRSINIPSSDRIFFHFIVRWTRLQIKIWCYHLGGEGLRVPGVPLFIRIKSCLLYCGKNKPVNTKKSNFYLTGFIHAIEMRDFGRKKMTKKSFGFPQIVRKWLAVFGFSPLNLPELILSMPEFPLVQRVQLERSLCINCKPKKYNKFAH